MTNGTGGGFPSDGDEADEDRSAARRDDGGSGLEGPSHENTEGIEILDDGADWLATQLAALPADTTDIPVLSDTDRAGGDAGAKADGPAEGDLDGDAPATRRFPVADAGDEDEDEDETRGEDAPTPVSARSDAPAPSPSDEPALTRPRAPEPVAGWFAPSSPPPPRPPLPTAAAATPAADAPIDRADAEPALGTSADDASSTEAAGASSADSVDASSAASPADTATPSEASAPAGRAHPNAINLPGLPKRAAAETDEPVTEPPAPTGAPTSDPAPARPVTTRPAAAYATTPPPGSGIPDDSGEIDFGNFAWSLVANDEDDPRVVRERREAEERAQAGRAAAQERSAAERAAAAEGAGSTAPSDDTPPQDAASDDDTDSRPSPAPGSGSHDGGPVESAAPASSDDAPSWSRPDLDGAFPATAAMDTLPADDDPDDPDDELDASGRFTALGTAAMPVSAASAAVGEADHVPAPASVGRAGNASDSVFPDGLVAESEVPGPERRPGRTTGRTGTAAPSRPTRARTASAGSRGSTRPLIAAGVVIVLALVGLFYLGTRLPLIFAGPATATSSATPTPTATPEPTAEQPASGPLAAGTYAWDELQGGECLEPYSSPWAEEFTVVDCAEPHAAQLVFTAPYTEDPATPFPGEDVIAAEIGLLCSAPGVVDFAAAAPFTDLQVQGAYPVSGEQWAAGDRDYFCFASRSSGEPLTASVATP